MNLVGGVASVDHDERGSECDMTTASLLRKAAELPDFVIVSMLIVAAGIGGVSGREDGVGEVGGVDEVTGING
ncbi:MAG: hypothetical protein AAGF98_11810 [Cyanobacteria bacterium P01_H01_bin.153]